MITGIWRFAEGEEFPQNDTEGPHVRLGGEYTVQDRFDRHPLDG